MAVALDCCRALAGPFALCWHKCTLKSLLSTCSGTISGIVGSFQSGVAFAGQRALTIES